MWTSVMNTLSICCDGEIKQGTKTKKGCKWVYNQFKRRINVQQRAVTQTFNQASVFCAHKLHNAMNNEYSFNADATSVMILLSCTL